MDEHRKSAYRFLLYWAMLEMRPLRWLPHRGQWLSPLFWSKHLRYVQGLGALADWLHNMADFSRRDFAGFDEKRFWEEFERLQGQHLVFAQYRSLFQNALIESQTGRWPRAEEQGKADT